MHAFGYLYFAEMILDLDFSQSKLAIIHQSVLSMLKV